jgi:hypothetical protein
MALRYDPNNVPQPINNMETFLNAILVELRAIRIALQEQNKRNIAINGYKWNTIYYTCGNESNAQVMSFTYVTTTDIGLVRLRINDRVSSYSSF